MFMDYFKKETKIVQNMFPFSLKKEEEEEEAKEEEKSAKFRQFFGRKRLMIPSRGRQRM